MNNLKLNSRGKDVEILQRALGITADGIFGSVTEAALKTFQRNYSLTPDGIAGPKTFAALGITAQIEQAQAAVSAGQSAGKVPTIIKDPLAVHVTKCLNRPIRYIAIHYTAGGSSVGGRARAVKSVFKSRSASADFCVDDRDIVQFNPDLRNYYCWSVGDNYNPNTSGGTLRSKATNKNTISIEICSNLKKGYSASAANHEGWHFTEASLQNALALVRHLMKQFNIPKDCVVRHYDITGKLCPGIVGWNNYKIYTPDGKATATRSTSSEWQRFLSQL